MFSVEQVRDSIKPFIFPLAWGAHFLFWSDLQTVGNIDVIAPSSFLLLIEDRGSVKA